MSFVLNLKKKIINGESITKDEAMKLIDVPLDELTKQADNIREFYCQNKFDVCTILNVKNGCCSEDCSFCAQSIHNQTSIKTYPMLSEDIIVSQSKQILDGGFKRISFVSSGRKIDDDEFDIILKAIWKLQQEYDDIHICVSLGLLTNKQMKLLKKCNVSRIHNNLESSSNYFKHICTTHSYNDKLDTLKTINDENLIICSGGIFGLGETFEDRIDLAMQLRNLNIKSIPINILNPIKGTPVEDNQILSNDEVCRIVAIFRFINPRSFIRMAGGRTLLSDNGLKAFQSGANACILGNMLTTMGGSIEDDLDMINQLGYVITYSLK